MEVKFFVELDKIPHGTSQMKGCRVVHGRPMFYTKKTVQDQMNFYGTILKMHRPAQPIEGAVRVEIGFCYPARRKKDIGAPKVTRPDLDNMAKSIIDAAMAVGYFKDDSQICELHLSKIYSDVSGIFFYCSTLEEAVNVPAIEQPKGEWIDSDPDSWQCSCCSRHVPRLYDYCPFCGAEMEVDDVRTDDHSADL